MLTICMVLAMCYFLAALIQLNGSVKREAQALAHIQEQCAAQEQENNELKRIMAEEEEDELIERRAREELGFIYPGEKVYAQSPVGE